MIALDPKMTFELQVLPTEVSDAPAVLVFKFPTAAEAARIDVLTDEADKDEEGDQEKKLLAALNLLLRDVKASAAQEVCFVLDVDAVERAKPMRVSTLTMAGRQAVMKLLKEVSDLPVAKGVPMLQAEVAGLHVAGADGFTIDELLEALRKTVLLSAIRGNGSPIAAGLLPVDELWRLVLRMRDQARLSEAERKKSALRLASAATRRSAGNAGRSA